MEFVNLVVGQPSIRKHIALQRVPLLVEYWYLTPKSNTTQVCWEWYWGRHISPNVCMSYPYVLELG